MIRARLSVISLGLPALFFALGCGQAQSPPSAPVAVASAPSAAAHGAEGGGEAPKAAAEEGAGAAAAPAARPAKLEAPAALVGASLPAVALTGTEGEVSQLKVVDAKPTVLVLWSTWCTNCLRETRELTAWAKSREDVSVLAVNVNGINGEEADVAKVRSHAAELGLTSPIWISAADDLGAMGVRTCPTTFVVDAKGVVRAAHEGYRGADEMNRWLDTNLRTL